MSHVPLIRRIRSKEEAQLILKCAAEDNDGIGLPTHVVIKNNEIVGAASLNVLSVLMAWNHSKKISPRDSIQIKHAYDAIMEEKTNGLPYIVLCNKMSPYNGVMKSLGYTPIWETEIFTSNPNVL